MRQTLSIFKGRRVLVTGDTGFKGSWLSLWLRELGAEVAGYALPPEQDRGLFNLLGLEGLIHHRMGDIRDFASVQRLCQDFQPEFLFHLAAQALVRRSFEHPKLTFDTNVGGSVNILEAARGTGSLRAIIFVTSDKCYRNREWVWGYRENDELGGQDPYSASKAAAEMVFAAYGDSFLQRQELGIASVRAGNILGGGDWAPDRLVPDVIKALMANRPIILRNPGATRPWQYILEPLWGYLLLAARLHENPSAYSGSWNFGPSGEAIRTTGDLAAMIVDQWGSGVIKVEQRAGDLHEAGLLHLNCDKARRILGWTPKWGFERTVAQTVSWYKGVATGESGLELTKRQLTAYMEGEND